MSCSSPDFKPFSSGCGMCKPSTDYYSQTQTGGGNYSEDGLIPQSNGKNFYKSVDYSLPLDSKFTKNNFGIDYATANGGVKKNKKSKSKRMMKGGVDIDTTDDVKGLSIGDYALFSTGGGKSNKDKKKSLKGGFPGKMIHHIPGEEMHHIPGEEMHNIAGQKMHNGGKKSKKSLKGGYPGMKMNSIPGEEMHYGGKKSKKPMSGGMESSGATSLPMRFYNPDTPLDNYPELSGNGLMSAYGPIESGDIGTGMLAPYTASTCQSANPSSSMKTGGGKKSKKSLKGGKGGPIPAISDSPVTSIQNGVNGAINGFSSFMAKLDADYLKSVEYVKSIKIGNQRLIQGGSKGKKSSKTVKKEKKEKKQKK